MSCSNYYTNSGFWQDDLIENFLIVGVVFLIALISHRLEIEDPKPCFLYFSSLWKLLHLSSMFTVRWSQKRNTLIKVVSIFNCDMIFNKFFKSVRYYKLDAQLPIYPILCKFLILFLPSTSFFHCFNLCPQEHALILRNTGKWPRRGKDRNPVPVLWQQRPGGFSCPQLLTAWQFLLFSVKHQFTNGKFASFKTQK